MDPEPRTESIFTDESYYRELLNNKKNRFDEIIIPPLSEDLQTYGTEKYINITPSIHSRSEIKTPLNLLYLHPKEDHNLIQLESRYTEGLVKPTKSQRSELLDRSLSKIVLNSLRDPVDTSALSFYHLPKSLLNGAISDTSKIKIDFSVETTRPEDLPELSLPILEFIEEIKPHIVIGCDRGGRLFSLALHAAWQQTRGGRPFPTLDGKLHFARVSKSEDPDLLQEKIDQIVMTSKTFGVQRDNEIATDEQLRVLFIDDWVIGGGTMRLAQRLMKKHEAQTYFAVMSGSEADATGQVNLHTDTSWHDRPEEIGVNYLSTIQENNDGTVSQRQEVMAIRSEEAIRNRQRILQAAQLLERVRILEQVA